MPSDVQIPEGGSEVNETVAARPTRSRKIRLLLAIGWPAVILCGLEVYDVPGRFLVPTSERGHRYVFIDGGAHLGETVQHFDRSVACSRLGWEVISFEANPHLIDRIYRGTRHTVLNKAIADKDGELPFYFSTVYPTLGGSLVEAKEDVDKSHPTMVEAVDLGRWLEDDFQETDYVWLKLDIEGAEYDVLTKLLSTGQVKYLDALSIEFHGQHVGVSEERDRELTRQLEERGVLVHAADTEIPGDWFRPRSCLPWFVCGLGVCGREPARWFGP